MIFLLTFADLLHFEMFEMDTDSAYLAISKKDIDRRYRLRKQKGCFLEEQFQWLPRNDTPTNAAYDKRTPGLFKMKWEGDGIVSLCSTTYFGFGSEIKISSKGMNKRTNDITKERNLDVLRSQVPGEVLGLIADSV